VLASRSVRADAPNFGFNDDHLNRDPSAAPRWAHRSRFGYCRKQAPSSHSRSPARIPYRYPRTHSPNRALQYRRSVPSTPLRRRPRSQRVAGIRQRQRSSRRACRYPPHTGLQSQTGLQIQALTGFLGRRHRPCRLEARKVAGGGRGPKSINASGCLFGVKLASSLLSPAPGVDRWPHPRQRPGALPERLCLAAFLF